MNIAIMIPLYKIMEAPAVQSLLTMVSDIHNHGDQYSLYFTQGIDIALARDTMVGEVLKQPIGTYDYILSLDTDHVYSASILYGLIEQMKTNKFNMLSAAYKARGMHDSYAHCMKNADGKVGKIPVCDDIQGIVSCYSVGFGFVVLETEFVRRLKNKHNRLFMFTPDFGEDVYFCDLVKSEGEKIYFDTRLKLGHLGTVIF